MLALRRTVWDRSVLFRWQPGDLLVLDNFLTAHGRMNVVQPRKILTAFGDLVTVPLAA
jgi:alpha-ketoglutarate-dependent taurine dioxygenase